MGEGRGWSLALLGVALVSRAAASAVAAASVVPAGSIATVASAAPAARSEPVAVVELFSSEGCSSCPPAEQLLGELAAAAKQSGRRILTLEFHVDYWNHLGYVDPFSAPAYSKRQQQYARALGASGLYTPQMIVNGTDEFVGSDRARATNALDAALARPATVRVTLRTAPLASGTRVSYQISAAPSGAQVHVALVESGLVSHVRGGENDGRTLAHTSVVRQFVTMPIAGRDAGSVDLKTGVSSGKTEKDAVVFVQDSRTMAILGAATARL